jgi:ABC-type Fe3+/spermidine/putrescine transport system ATPase subunit
LAAFSARGITVRFGAVEALAGVDLEIASGEIFVLLGGSGSGKTTLLRCAGGFVTPSAGTITLDGRDITLLPPHARPVNTMFQSYALFPHMSVAGNIAFGLRGMAAPARRARVGEMLDLVRLPGYERRRITELSGGQQQRVALARSLAPRPGLLLLDEPFSALDRALRDATRAEFLALLRRLGTTAILVTHDQDEALTSADRLGVLHHGRLAQVGTPADLYDRPASRFIAGFLGAANLLDATVRESGPDGRLELAGGAFVRAATSAHVGAAVALALRPERLSIHDTTESCDRTNRIDGVVAGLTYRGSALEIAVTLPSGSELRVSRTLARGFAAPPRTGAPVVVTWAPSASIVVAE